MTISLLRELFLIYLRGCYKSQIHFNCLWTPCSNNHVWTFEPRGGKTLRRYEILFIANADSSEGDLDEIIERYKTIITQLHGIVVKVEKWGSRKLAYEIKKQRKGIYVLLDFAGESVIVPELERMLKIEDKILKFITVMKENKVNPLDLEKEKQSVSPAEIKIEAPEIESPITSTEAETPVKTDEQISENAKGDSE